jgi:hypothetical protein
MKKKNIPKGHRRKEHVPRVNRRISADPMPKINTIEGEKCVMVMKPCKKCKSYQPINNFYFKSLKFRKKFDDNDPRSRRTYCAPCWDEVNK